MPSVSAPDGSQLSTSPSTRPSSIPSLRALLLRLLLICLVPGLVGIAVLMYRMYEDGRRQIEKDTLLTARAMVTAVDSQFDAARVVAVALSQSNFIASEDWPGFHRRASELIKREGFGVNVFLIDAEGQHRVNTLVPWGMPLPKPVLTAEVRLVFDTAKPVLSPLFRGGVTGKPRLVVMVPVFDGPRVVYALGIGIDTDQLAGLLRDQRLPADWVSSISDRNGVIAARSLQGEKFVGQLVNPEITRRLLAAPEAAFEAVTKEGVPALLAYSRSTETRWTVAIAIPLASLQADLKRNLLWLGASGLLLFVAGGWFAQRLAQRIAGSVKGLAESAQAVASGDNPRTFDAGFREADQACQAMALTAELLSQRAQALSATHAALLERDLVLADAQRLAHIGSWYWDARTDRTVCSDEMCRIFGRDEIPPLAEQCGVLYPRQAWQRLSLATDLAAEVGTAYELELPALYADGSPIWVAVRAEAVRSADGQIVGARGTVQDISARKLAEADARRMDAIETENRQIHEASRMKSQFLANMSHELRTPLNAVIGFADLLHAGFVKPDSPKHQEFLGLIGTSGRHLLQLINDVLDLSKVESGKFDFFPEAVDLPTVLKEVQDILHTASLRKNIVLVTEIDPAVAGLRLDPSRLKQVLYNYLSNAIKFTAEHGRVTVRAFAQGPDHFRLEVEDTGIGIAPADLPRLFTEFQQLDAGYSKQHQGTGLGLALTRRLVQAQGGSVGVRSTLGVGSVFYLVLNRVHGTDADRSQSQVDPVDPPDRVLVIEDDPHHQERLVAAIAQAGFEVDAAADSGEALRKARGTRYAALTLDLSLPSQRGLDLLASIRSHGASQATPVVGVTVPADEQSATFPMTNLLCKPIRSDEILLAMAPYRLLAPERAKVLVIDDDPHALDLMRATLLSIGIDAVCVQDGRDALRDIDQIRPDAIILDLMMPVFDGFQVLDALQRLPAWRQVPVYIWTSLLLTDEECALLARSARAILAKGGGGVADLLEGLRRWRGAVEPGQVLDVR